MIIIISYSHCGILECPIAVGPKQYTSPVCLGCHAPVSLAGYRSISSHIFLFRSSLIFLSKNSPILKKRVKKTVQKSAFHSKWLRQKPPTISIRLDFLKCVQIFPSRFLYRFAFWRKGKCRHTWENLDGQKYLGVSNSGLILYPVGAEYAIGRCVVQSVKRPNFTGQQKPYHPKFSNTCIKC